MQRAQAVGSEQVTVVRLRMNPVPSMWSVSGMDLKDLGAYVAVDGERNDVVDPRFTSRYPFSLEELTNRGYSGAFPQGHFTLSCSPGYFASIEDVRASSQKLRGAITPTACSKQLRFKSSIFHFASLAKIEAFGTGISDGGGSGVGVDDGELSTVVYEQSDFDEEDLWEPDPDDDITMGGIYWPPFFQKECVVCMEQADAQCPVCKEYLCTGCVAAMMQNAVVVVANACPVCKSCIDCETQAAGDELRCVCPMNNL